MPLVKCPNCGAYQQVEATVRIDKEGVIRVEQRPEGKVTLVAPERGKPHS